MKMDIINKVIESLEKKYPKETWDCTNIEEAILETIDYLEKKSKRKRK